METMVPVIVTPTDIPGLVNVELPDGTMLYDVTRGQFFTLAMRDGWEVIRP